MSVSTADAVSQLLSEFARTMLTDFSVQGILDPLVIRIAEVMPVSAAEVTLISADGQSEHIAASHDHAMRFAQLQAELGDTPGLAAWQSGDATHVADLSSAKQFTEFARQARGAGIAAVFSFPLRHGDLRLGALSLYRDTAGALPADSLEAAQTLADIVAAYLINAEGRAALRASTDQSREAALHDPLTGLPNRLLLLELLNLATGRAQQSRNRSAVFLIALDRFRTINDAHSHRVGDLLLSAVAERLTSVLRPGDRLARVGGDEFAALCQDLQDEPQAVALAVQFDTALAAPFLLPGAEVAITASIGVAFIGTGDDAAEQVLREADLAMNRVKRNRGGGNRGLDLRRHLDHYQRELELALPGAAERGELRLDYQPIVSAADGRLIGAEALLRWAHPDRGLIPPTVLIPLAEQSGHMVEIGQWVLREAWKELGGWHQDVGQHLSMSVNVSTQQLMSTGFADAVASVLEGSSAQAGRLTLEVTESVFVRDGERALFVLNDLKDIGVKLALDDFGTGYSSLGYLRRFPVDIIKVDREFIANLGQDPASRTIVTSVIQLAHGLGMAVTSEGVETPEQHHELAKLGSDSCQGFYYARPMPARELAVFRHEGIALG